MAAAPETTARPPAVGLPKVAQHHDVENPLLLPAALVLGAGVALLMAGPAGLLAFGVLVGAFLVTLMSWYL
jgi:hypothetical protein